MIIFNLPFSFILVVGAMSASNDPAIFFPDIKGNLTKITWAHAVNNKTYLENTLKNMEILMVEADIVLGKLNGTGDDMPIMGHPPNNVSDISLDQFLSTIDTFNNDSINMNKRKGVKLDFKSIDVFLQSLTIVKKYDKGSYPLWINADILVGPINATTTPVNAVQFLQNAKQFNTSILSIGWTTNYGSNMAGSYTENQINLMINVIQENNVSQNITFPVRAGLAAESLKQMKTLLSKVKDSTLTIWSSAGDNVNVANLRSLIGHFGVEKVYVDVPEDLLRQLHLENLPNRGNALFGLPFLIVGTLIAFSMKWIVV